ncbi:MAG: Rrf2 family transcriptional regulator [Bacteroidetes bacterium]|nr:Rrf2 family transcriptional regulator [Bacteroidota bacterium]
MSRIIALTEAASIAIHGMIILARSEGSVSVNQIAEVNNSSRHHVAKIFQRLVKEGYVSSNRGPNGGFLLKKSADKITLLDIYEVIEGRLSTHHCPLEKPICPFDQCIFENKIKEMAEDFRDFLQSRTLLDYQ